MAGRGKYALIARRSMHHKAAQRTARLAAFVLFALASACQSASMPTPSPTSPSSLPDATSSTDATDSPSVINADGTGLIEVLVSPDFKAALDWTR
jgi:hypothetical protein